MFQTQVEPHIDPYALKQKITSLFEYRLFDALLNKVEESDKDKSIFWDQLIDLQTAIYHLDAHLEAHWQTNDDVLAQHWKQIEYFLHKIDAKAQDQTYLNHIKKYEKHELELRYGKLPTRLSMEYFYFYKSCDVKLLRRLIYEKYGLQHSFGSLADWRYYDLVTEVNDDVEDVFEDLSFINGNRFLISLLYIQKQKVEKMFITFLEEIRKKAGEKVSSNRVDFQQIIYTKTCERIEETKEMMASQLDKIRIEDLKHSKLFQYCNFPILSS